MGEPLGQVLTIDDLAVYLKISKSTLYKLVGQGKIPSQKVGRHWRFRKDAIDLWLDGSPIVAFSKDAKPAIENRDRATIRRKATGQNQIDPRARGKE